MRKVILALTLSVSGMALAAQSQPLDLLQAWQAAKQNDPNYAAAVAAHEAGQQKQRQSRALLLPQVQVGAALGLASVESRTSGAQFTAPGFGTSEDVDFRTSIKRGHTQRWNISAEQPLYDAGRFASSRQLGKQAELADVQFANAQQELILRVAQAYFELLGAIDTETMLESEQKAAQRALDEAKQRFESGAIPITDANEAQARFDMVAAQLLAARDNTELKRAAFVDLTGASSVDPARADGNADVQAGTLSDWQQRAANNNPLLAMQMLGLDIARADVDKYRALTSPTLSLIAQAGDDRMWGSGDYGSSEILNSNWIVGVQFRMPLFTGGMRSAKRAEAEAEVEKTRWDLAALRQVVARQTQAAWLGVTSGRSRVDALQQAQHSAQLRLQSTQLGYDNGARTALDLLNAQTDFYGAQRAVKQARYDLWLNSLRLAAAAGALDEQQLSAVNRHFENAK